MYTHRCMCIHAPPVVAEDASTPDSHRDQSISIHRRQLVVLEHISRKREREKRKREKKRKIEEEKEKEI